MSLLPKSTSEFSKSDYWNAFFKQRGKKAFEWYGEYPELCGYLHKYVKAKDKVLISGCGNSKLGADLYDVGYRNTVNIDISKVVIKQMKSLHEKDRPELEFLEMDALNMTFDSESFTVVIDKGTLDALMPEDDEDSLKTATKFFDEIDRVLKQGGRYICISLLQSHILNHVLSTFVDKGWMIRICRCFEAESKAEEEGPLKGLPVFVTICTKFKKMNNSLPILELGLTSDGNIIRVSSVDTIKEEILEVQKVAIVCRGLQKSSTDGTDIQIDIRAPGNPLPKYQITVVDNKNSSKVATKRYSAFIVPQGRETEWMFGTPEGRQYLIMRAMCDRIALITLPRGHTFGSLKDIQDELSPIILDMAPQSYKPPIEFLSIGGDVGSRKEICRGHSAVSGDYLIEECQIDDSGVVRRLFFLSNTNIIQSEAKMKTGKSRKGNERTMVDKSSLSCDHHAFMSVGVSSVNPSEGDATVLVIGLGGGSLVSYLHLTFPQIRITAVDLDPEIVNIATKYFDLVIDSRITISVLDGLQFIKEAKEKGSRYDAILFDVDSKDASVGMSCPPPSFVEPEILKNVKEILTDKGLFILNLVCRNESLRDKVYQRIKSTYGTVASVKQKEHLNEVVFCWKEKNVNARTVLSESSDKLCQIIKKKKREKLECIEARNLLEQLVIS